MVVAVVAIEFITVGGNSMLMPPGLPYYSCHYVPISINDHFALVS